MRALIARDYGPLSALEVGETPKPSVEPGSVLVEIEAAALNPFDVKLLTGQARAMMSITFPYIPGMDGAGKVAAVGEGVTDFEVGDQVVGFFRERAGTVAEYALIRAASFLTRRPEGLDAQTASAIPEAGLTAKALVDGAQAQPGQKVLVIGATGGIGIFVVQLLARAGAHVIATTTPVDSKHLQDLGATQLIDYKIRDVVEAIDELYIDGIDVVIDLIGSGDALTHSAEALRDGGRLVSPLCGPSEFERDIEVVYTGASATEPADLEWLVEQVAADKLKVEVSRTYSLDDARQAYLEFSTRHKRGKVVILV